MRWAAMLWVELNEMPNDEVEMAEQSDSAKMRLQQSLLAIGGGAVNASVLKVSQYLCEV